MVGIATHAKTDQLGINLGATGLGVFELFQHQHPGAITQHETVAIFIPRTAGLGGLVVAVGERLGGGKTAHPHRGGCLLGTTGHHHVRIAVGDHATGHADGMGACGTGGGDGDVGALQASHDGEMTGHHIDDGGRYEEGAQLAGTAVDQAAVVLLNQTQTADAGTDRHTDALGILLVDDETGIIQRLHACGDAVLDEEIHLASFFAVDTVLLGIEILDLACEAGRKLAGVKVFDGRNAALPVEQGLPAGFGSVAYRGKHPQAGHHDSAF